MRCLAVVTAVLLSLAVTPWLPAQVRVSELSPTDDHVPELARYLDRLQLSEPVRHRGLEVYTLQLIDGDTLEGRWLTLDEALDDGVLDISEKGQGGSVPAVVVENRSRSAHVFIMSGEIIKGGKQTRTVRHDVILAPGQEVELTVFCVEESRWQGGSKFAPAKQIVPQSISKALRAGADQQQVWREVDRNNEALGTQNATKSLEVALAAPSVRKKLDDAKKFIAPGIPRGTTGFIFVAHGRAVGADYFGSEEIAREMLPKLIESYSVDFLLQKHFAGGRPDSRQAAIDFYDTIRRAGSSRSNTLGSGAGIITKNAGLIGSGVSLGGTLAHYGAQPSKRFVPAPKPIIRPQR